MAPLSCKNKSPTWRTGDLPILPPLTVLENLESAFPVSGNNHVKGAFSDIVVVFRVRKFASRNQLKGMICSYTREHSTRVTTPS